MKVAILQIPKKCADICAYRYARVIPQEENSPWREVSRGKGACAGKSPESSELIRQEEIAENLLKPATFFHPAAVTDATSAPSIALRLR